MNLYFRLIWLLLSLPFIKKSGNPLEITTLHFRALPTDIDLNFHINNGRYLTLMDLGRIHCLSSAGLLKNVLKKKWAPVVGSAKVHFIRSVDLFEKFSMTTQVVYWDEKWFYMEQKVFKGDELCVVALFKGLFTSKKGKITPEEVISLLPHPPKRPPLPHALDHWMEAEKKSR